MIWGAVRGRIPYVSFAILAVFWGCWCLVESAGPDMALWIFYLSCLAVLLLIPYFTPAAIRWRTRCREERLAFSVAVKSGADLTTLEVREYPLKKVSIGVYLVLALAVLGLSGLAELKVFCTLKARGGSCHVLDHGTDEGMLKEGNYAEDLMQVVDMKLAMYAQPLYEARVRFIEQLEPIVAEYYKALSGGSEKVGIKYESDLHKGPLDQILASRIEKDRILRYTTAGLQRDDFVFEMDGMPIRRCGSQGQQKSFLVALKFAQYDIMKKTYGFAPMLLLDDVFDKLDMGRISNLLGMVSSSDFGQIFITDCNKVRLRGIVDSLTSDRAYFETSGGVFTKA